MPNILYRKGNDLDLNEVIDLYHASMLGERRPIDNRDRMASMVENANLVITAWDGDLLVGIARSLTDFSYAAYLSDLAVHLSYQKQGIGKELIRQTQKYLHPKAKLILLSAPAAVDYYPRIGFTHHPQAWFIEAQDELE